MITHPCSFYVAEYDLVLVGFPNTELTEGNQISIYINPNTYCSLVRT